MRYRGRRHLAAGLGRGARATPEAQRGVVGRPRPRRHKASHGHLAFQRSLVAEDAQQAEDGPPGHRGHRPPAVCQELRRQEAQVFERGRQMRAREAAVGHCP